MTDNSFIPVLSTDWAPPSPPPPPTPHFPSSARQPRPRTTYNDQVSCTSDGEHAGSAGTRTARHVQKDVVLAVSENAPAPVQWVDWAGGKHGGKSGWGGGGEGVV